MKAIAATFMLCAWSPLLAKQGANASPGKIHWLSLSVLSFAWGLNKLVQKHAEIGKDHQNWSEDRFKEAYTKALECSHLMPELSDGKRQVWRNEEKGITLTFNQEQNPEHAFEVISTENSKYKEFMLDISSTFHGLEYILQKDKVTYSFPNGPGREGFLQIFQNTHPQKQFLNTPVLEYGQKTFNGSVLLKGEILLIDDTLEGSILHEEYKTFLSKTGFVEMDIPNKLFTIINYTYNRLEFDDQATKKVMTNVVWSEISESSLVGNHSLPLKLDHFLSIGKGECRHRAALMGYLIERLVEDGHLDGEVTYLSNNNHSWVGFKSYKENVLIELGNS